MIKLDKIIGNIKIDHNLKSMHEEMIKLGKIETVTFGRMESERTRIRKVSNKGTDIALILSEGSRIRGGDVLFLTQEQMIVIQIVPEPVAIIQIHKILIRDQMIRTSVTIGHALGNLHRPLKIQGDTITFPIQDPSEVALIEKLLSSLKEHIEVRSDNMVFEANMGS
jgi:urease accessory protein